MLANTPLLSFRKAYCCCNKKNNDINRAISASLRFFYSYFSATQIES